MLVVHVDGGGAEEIRAPRQVVEGNGRGFRCGVRDGERQRGPVERERLSAVADADRPRLKRRHHARRRERGTRRGRQSLFGRRTRSCGKPRQHGHRTGEQSSRSVGTCNAAFVHLSSPLRNAKVIRPCYGPGRSANRLDEHPESVALANVRPRLRLASRPFLRAFRIVAQDVQRIASSGLPAFRQGRSKSSIDSDICVAICRIPTHRGVRGTAQRAAPESRSSAKSHRSSALAQYERRRPAR